MALNKIHGGMLESNLLRYGQNLGFETNLLYIDVASGSVGINTSSPSGIFNVNGIADINSLRFSGNTITEVSAGGLTIDTSGQSVGFAGAPLINVLDPTNLQDVVTVNYLNDSAFIKADGTTSMTGNLDIDDNRITNLANGVDTGDAVNKRQLDAAQAGILVKAPCRVTTNAVLPTVTASGSGVGKTLTATAVGVLTIDDVATVLGDRILIKDQAAGVDNGVYDITTEGTAGVAFVLTRATDYDGNPSGEVAAGSYMFIAEGTENSKSGWTLIEVGLTGGGSPTEAVVDTDDLTFVQFQGLPQYIAGNQLTLDGNTFNVTEGSGSGLDADTLDSLDSTSFLRSDAADTHSATITPSLDNVIDLGAGGSRYNTIYATSFIGIASSATKLETARTIDITGDITATAVAFDGTSNIEISASVNDDSHTHDTRYFTEGESDIRYLRANAADTHSGTITPNVNNTINLGSSGLRYNTVYATTFNGISTSARYADLAENYAGDKEIETGTVVCYGGTQEVTTCMHNADRAVAGVVSTHPAHLMNDDIDAEFKIAVALRGRVPCKVSGSVKKGDMMVSAGNGRARAEADPKLGQVIGKALADSEGDAVIEVVIG